MRFISAGYDLSGREVFVVTEVRPTSQGGVCIYYNQANFNASAQILSPSQSRRRSLGGKPISPLLGPVNYKGRRLSLVTVNLPKRRYPAVRSSSKGVGLAVPMPVPS